MGWPGDWGRCIGGSLSLYLGVHLATPYPEPSQHLSDSYPTSIRQTVNAWNWGTCGHRGELPKARERLGLGYFGGDSYFADLTSGRAEWLMAGKA